MLIMAVTMSNTAGMFQLFYNILTDGLCIYRYVWFTNKWNVYSVCLLMCHYMNSCVFNMFKLLQCYYSIYGKVYIQYVSKMNNLTEILCLYITVILFSFLLYRTITACYCIINIFFYSNTIYASHQLQWLVNSCKQPLQ